MERVHWSYGDKEDTNKCEGVALQVVVPIPELSVGSWKTKSPPYCDMTGMQRSSGHNRNFLVGDRRQGCLLRKSWQRSQLTSKQSPFPTKTPYTHSGAKTNGY